MVRFSPWFAVKWRIWILRLWGADISWSSNVYCNLEIWSPLNLTVGDGSTLSNGIKIYNVAPVTIGSNTTISDGVYICTASKTTDMKNRKLKVAGIFIGNDVWVASNVTVLPGVTIGNGSAVLYGIDLFESVKDNSIVKPKKNYLILEKFND